jgi:hypothetical protein
VSDIQQELASLANARVTPAVLSALDYVVPGEWTNVTSLDDMIRTQLGVQDPTEVARIRERATALWQQKPHYQRALTIYRAVDTADKAVAAAVAANALGNTFSFLGFLDKLTPKPDTTQALDAALKLAAEVAAFTTLRGLPIHSLAEAQAFPAALATYAKADMMRLAAWIAIDGILPLGPEFVQKIVSIVQGVDTSVLTNNPLFNAIKGNLPGSSVDEQKGFLVSTLGAGSSYISEFVSARGLTQASLASKLGSLVNVADKGMDAMAVALDVSTDYFSHTGLQSVARVLVHDAQESLAAGETVSAAVAAAPAEEGSSWFKTAAMVAGGGAAVTALGAAGVAVAGVAGAAALWNSWGNDDDEEDEKLAENAPVDPALAQLDDNALAAREQAIELQARQLMAGGQMTPELQQQMMMLRRQRQQMRRARRMRMMAMMQQGRPGMGRMGMGMGRRGMGGGMGRGGGGMGRGRF